MELASKAVYPISASNKGRGGFAVLDFETTGFTNSDRVLEIGLVLLAPDCSVEERWQTLVQPDRGFDNSHIHGITPTGLVDAPTFAQVARRFVDMLDGRIVVAHNAAFEYRFLRNEFSRLGITLPQRYWLLDTMELGRSVFPGLPMNLPSLLEYLGLTNVSAHTALADADATAQALKRLIDIDPTIRKVATPLHFDDQDWESLPESDAALIARAGSPFAESMESNNSTDSESTRGSEEAQWLLDLSTELPRTGDDSSDQYLALLVEAMVDGRLNTEEETVLHAASQELGLTIDDVEILHELCIQKLIIQAWADGVVTDRERNWLLRIAGELGIGYDRVESLIEEHNDLHLCAGDRVTFTGAMVTPREVWESRAKEAGLDVGGVIRRSAVVVAADINTRSGKAKKARQLGIPIVDEFTFAQALSRLTATDEDLSASNEQVESEVIAGVTSPVPVDVSSESVATEANSPFIKALMQTEPTAESGTSLHHGPAFKSAVEYVINSAHPQHNFAAVFPWLTDSSVVGNQRDVISIAKAWINRFDSSELLLISPFLTEAALPETANWQRVTGRLVAAGMPGTLEVSVKDIQQLPGYGRIRVLNLVVDAVTYAVDEFESAQSEDIERKVNDSDISMVAAESTHEFSAHEFFGDFDSPASDFYEEADSDSDADRPVFEGTAAIGGTTSSPSAPNLHDVQNPGYAAFLDWLSVTRSTDELLNGVSEFAPKSVQEQLQSLTKRADYVVTNSVQEIQHILGQDSRYSAILNDRMVGKASLEQVGQQFGVTRERIRQLEASLGVLLADAGQSTETLRNGIFQRFAPLAHVSQITDAIPSLADSHEGMSAPFLQVLSLTGTAEAQFPQALWEITDDWFLAKDFVELFDRVITENANGYGVVPLQTVAEALGTSSALIDEWICEKTDYRIYDECVFTKVSSVSDRAVALLAHHGKPMHIDEIAAIMTDRNGRAIDGRLATDERACRSARGTWALSEWGLEEWTSIVDFIARRLEDAAERGENSVAISRLIDEATPFGVSENSVRTYAGSGDFICEDGRVRRRTEDEHPTLDATPEESKGLYLRDGVWSLLLTINHDHVRGSGCGIPSGVAGMYGCNTAGRRYSLHGSATNAL